ncbi:MAG: hypothetical protein GF398_02535 [Chitinivibrionales bacterium]|nr:hypothetical protein [Chitinivibrionales bacterium]
MPRGDGTGPWGWGAGTGRRMGGCRRLFTPGGRLRFHRIGIASALIPIAGAALKDALNPAGYLQTFVRKMLSQQSSSNRKKVDAHYTVFDEIRDRSV